MNATAELTVGLWSERSPPAGEDREAADRRSQAAPIASVKQSPAGPFQAERRALCLTLHLERPAGLRSLPHTAVA